MTLQTQVLTVMSAIMASFARERSKTSDPVMRAEIDQWNAAMVDLKSQIEADGLTDEAHRISMNLLTIATDLNNRLPQNHN